MQESQRAFVGIVVQDDLRTKLGCFGWVSLWTEKKTAKCRFELGRVEILEIAGGACSDHRGI